MSHLSDSEIMAALPAETRQKIDSAFEALSQSLPTDRERLILYRVATALKLSPTDTHFSVLAAMHYYLQLYQAIPDKIANAGRAVITAGREVDAILREATKDTLTEHTRALEAQTEHFSQRAIAELSVALTETANNIARDSQIHAKQLAFEHAAIAISAVAMTMYLAGFVHGAWQLASLASISVALIVGILCGISIAHVVPQVPESSTWTSGQFIAASLSIQLPDQVMLACRDVLVERDSVSSASAKRNVNPDQIRRAIVHFKQIRSSHVR